MFSPPGIAALLTHPWVTNQAQALERKAVRSGALRKVLVSKQGPTGAHDAQCKYVPWRARLMMDAEHREHDV